jgi:acyl-CoA-dependent ceramide synthase
MAGAKPQSQARRGVDKFERPTEHSSQPIFYVSVAAVLAGYYAYPHKTNPLYPAIFLSYPVPTSMTSTQTQYGKGPKDLIYVGFYTLVLFAARDFIRHYVSPVLARSWGVHDAYKQTRFSQELYQAVYFASMAAFGLYIMRGTPVWFFNMPGLFVGFPHRTLDAGFKAFYLIQSANWVQQAAVTFLGLEKARKDTAVMVSHHIVTLTAIPLIYNAHMTSFALALIIPHDISDALLAVS